MVKKFLFTCIWLHMSLLTAFAESNNDNLLGIDNDKLRDGDLTFEDIPQSIQSITNFVLSFVGTIAMIMIIVGGLRYALGSVEGNAPNKSKAQETIKFGIFGFVVSVFSYYIIQLLLNNF